MKSQKEFENRLVEKKFFSYPKDIHKKMMQIRQLIFKIAKETPEVGKLEETLKWGEPSYVTSETKSGSTIRVDSKQSKPDYFAVYFNCKTTLVDTFKEMYGDIFQYEGNRSIVFHKDDKIPLVELSNCILMALTYHISKKQKL